MPVAAQTVESATPARSDAALSARLRAHVAMLASTIGERNSPHYDGLERARFYIADQLRAAGYEPRFQTFEHQGKKFHNVEATLGPVGGETASVVVGAHYDSVAGSPGANDNASGVAVLIELARLLRGRALGSPLRFVAFVNEEPPYFNSGEGMGSVEYVRALQREQHQVSSMLSLETVGMYSDAPASQKYPPLVGSFYPDRGNFIGFVGDLSARSLMQRVLDTFRRASDLPSEGAALPSFVPGVSWSDHRSFSAAGIAAIMVTDTAPFRDPHYHLASDTPERLNYDNMARLTLGLVPVIEELADARGKKRQD